MMLLGKIYKIDEYDGCCNAIVIVEAGFQSDVYVLRVPLGRLHEKLVVGSSVLFTGRSVRRDEFKYVTVDTIIRQEFKSCEICKLPLTSENCFLNHDREVERLEGHWRLIHKEYSRGYLKTFFQKELFVLPTKMSCNSWLYDVFDDINQGDLVSLAGWRSKKDITLVFCRKVE